MIECLVADWDAPARVKALCTTRKGGFSEGDFDAFNLATHVGDAADAVQRNRELLCNSLGLPSEPRWLNQTHSCRVVTLEQQSGVDADAAITRKPGLVAAVMTADCLPLLLSNRAGSEVAAVHAGWRGLLDGVVQATVSRMTSTPEELLAWVGPAISQPCFEVGAEVRDAFIATSPTAEARFSANRPGHWLCDLPGLAVDLLERLKITQTRCSGLCSYRDRASFYSYRRNATTGRMASLIWIDPQA